MSSPLLHAPDVAEEEAALITAADASRARVAAGDGDGWLSLFADDAWIEDPVGAPRHGAERSADRAAGRAADARRAFHGVFIAPNKVAMRVLDDFVDVDRGVVVRDVELSISDPGAGADGSAAALRVPALLRYSVDHAGRISSLQAFWNPTHARPVWEHGGDLWAVLLASLAQMWRVFATFGLVWGLHYLFDPASAALTSRVRRATGRLVDALGRRDERALLGLLDAHAHIDVCAEGERASWTSLQFAQQRLVKKPVIVHAYTAGHWCAARLRLGSSSSSSSSSSNGRDAILIVNASTDHGKIESVYLLIP